MGGGGQEYCPAWGAGILSRLPVRIPFGINLLSRINSTHRSSSSLRFTGLASSEAGRERRNFAGAQALLPREPNQLQQRSRSRRAKLSVGYRSVRISAMPRTSVSELVQLFAATAAISPSAGSHSM